MEDRGHSRTGRTGAGENDRTGTDRTGRRRETKRRGTTQHSVRYDGGDGKSCTHLPTGYWRRRRRGVPEAHGLVGRHGARGPCGTPLAVALPAPLPEGGAPAGPVESTHTRFPAHTVTSGTPTETGNVRLRTRVLPGRP